MNNDVTIFAHRGASGTYPENTMAAFEAAVKLGAGGIELDVQMTKDGEIVIIHDETVNRTTNGEGAVARMTYKEIASLDAGSWFHKKFKGEKIPTLEQFFMWASKNNLQINIELKTNKFPYHGIEQRVLELIQKHRMRGRVIISSFNMASLERVLKIDPYIAAAGLVWRMPREAVMTAKKLGLTALHTQVSFALSEYGKEAVDNGMLLRLYTINEVREWKRVEKSGVPVEAIITDFPERFSGKAI